MLAREAVIREARASDAEAIARVHLGSSEEAYAPLAKEWPVRGLAATTARWVSWLEASHADARRVDLVAELDGVVVAFVGAGPARRSDVGVEVEVYVIHVLPEHRGQALGGRLWDEVCKRVRGEARRAMFVATIAELRCCSFYEARGGTLANEGPRVFHGATVTDRVYIWPAGKSNEPMPKGQTGQSQ